MTDDIYVVKMDSENPMMRYITVEGELLRAEFPEQHRTKRVREIGGMAWREVEGTGRFVRSRVRLWAHRPEDRERRVRYASGSSAPTGQFASCRLSEVPGVVHRLQPEAIEEIARLDEQIEELRARISELKRERSHAVGLGFLRGQKVTQKEIKELAEEHLRQRLERSSS